MKRLWFQIDTFLHYLETVFWGGYTKIKNLLDHFIIGNFHDLVWSRHQEPCCKKIASILTYNIYIYVIKKMLTLYVQYTEKQAVKKGFILAHMCSKPKIHAKDWHCLFRWPLLRIHVLYTNPTFIKWLLFSALVHFTQKVQIWRGKNS